MAVAAGAGVKGLFEDGASVPDRFVFPSHLRVKNEEFISAQGVPVIDFSQDNATVVQKVADAAATWGFFQVENHDVPLELMESMLDVSRQFFDMSPEDKMHYYAEGFNTPVAYGTSYDPSKEEHLEWHDHLLHIFPSLQEEHPWPEKPASYRETAKKYLEHLALLAERIAAVLSEGLGLDPGYLSREMRSPRVLMRLNYYPPCRSSELVLGQISHCDYGAFTIVMQDHEGLQLLHNGNWRTVEARSGTFVVNVADQVELWSNTRFKSVRHRVAVNPRETRISIATFFTPNSEVLVSPIPELIDELHPPVYQGCVYKDYVAKTNPAKRVLDSLKVQK